MNAQQIERIRPWLTPISALYGIGVRLRNYLFDKGILKSESFRTPIVCVGNLCAGGTGKTPHVEFIISQLQSKYRIAVLSRGYKRKSKGLLIASLDSTATEIGDEPRQIKQKFPLITVVVDANRRRAIRYLESLAVNERPELIILDDGFQHRYVKPCLAILIEDYYRLQIPKKLLPAGDLREPISARKRGDCMIISKCPLKLQPISYRIMERDLELYPHQKLFFTYMHYAPLKAIFDEASLEAIDAATQVLAVAGIANPTNFMEELQQRYGKERVELMSYSDHHSFDDSDIRAIADKWNSLQAESEACIFITTEKDAMRLVAKQNKLPKSMQMAAFYLPIEPNFAFKSSDSFIDLIDQAIFRHKLATDNNPK